MVDRTLIFLMDRFTMQYLLRSLALASFILFSFTACASKDLRFIGDVNLTTGTIFQNTEIGGLSGLSFDQESNKLIAVSDDRSQVNEARFYQFDFTLTQEHFTVTPFSVVKLRDGEGHYYKEKYPDFEGIAVYGNDFLISSENGLDGTAPVLPGLYLFNAQGEFKSMLEVPAVFLNSADGTNGIRNNKGFETLSVTPDNEVIFMANEDSLLQDGPVASPLNASVVRVIRYKNSKPEKEFAYELEKMQSPPTGMEEKGDTGLVDIAALDQNTFYSLERSYLTATNKNVILIFKNQILDETTDVSSMNSLAKRDYNPIKKTLIANLDEFIPSMDHRFARLDNIEGITLGPVLPNGSRSLIVVSDNNFNPTQRTLFMAFEILGSK